MTVTIVKQLSLQPKDTFRDLRRRLVRGEDHRDPDSTSELVYSRTVDGVSSVGSTSFSYLPRGEVFARSVTAEVRGEVRCSLYDHSATAPDPARGSLLTRERVCCDEVVPEERVLAAEALLLAEASRVRAVNRSLAARVRELEDAVLSRWLDGHGESRRPLLELAPLDLPVLDYLEALDVLGSVHVVPARIARLTVGTPALVTLASSPGREAVLALEKRAASALVPGDVVRGGWSHWVFESLEVVSGSARSTGVLRGRRVLDGEPVVVTNREPDAVELGYRVIGRAEDLE